MLVKERMTPVAHCCRPHELLTSAARLMWEHDCGCVPVVDERNVLLGMVTDRDACMAAYTKGQRLDEIPVQAVMTKKAWTCRADDTIETAELLMRSHQIRRLPVVDAANKVVGVLSSTDLVRTVAAIPGPQRAQKAEQLVQTLAAIGAPRQLPAVAAKPAVASATPLALPRPAEVKPMEPKAQTAEADKSASAGKNKGKR